MTFARRYIDVTFTGPATVKFAARGKYALRTSARVLHAGGFNQGTLQLEIRGLSLEHIKQLTTYGTRVNPYYGYGVQVDAGDEVNGMSTVFVGQINQAWADMKAMPDCPFHVVATMGGKAATMPTEPSSFQGPTPATTILRQLAGKAGLGFEDNGVQAQLADPYFWGSPWKQMKEVIDASNCYGVIDNGVLAVWPTSGSRQGNLLVTPPHAGVQGGSNMRDYPSFTELGVQVRVEFKTAITYGSQMTIQGSDMTPANGTWNIIRIDYDLQANTPKGNWFAVLDGSQFFTQA